MYVCITLVLSVLAMHFRHISFNQSGWLGVAIEWYGQKPQI